MMHTYHPDSLDPIKITHVVTGLGVGGAETMLLKLLSHMDRQHYDADVISLTDIGPIGAKIQDLGIPVKALGLRRGLPNPISALRLVLWLRQRSPHLVQTWMYHADLVGGLAARLAGVSHVVWGIRHGNLDPAHNKRRTLQIVKLNAFLSPYLPSHIVCCAESAREVHAQAGYANRKMLVIPNGFDLSKFRPDDESRKSVRNELGLPGDTPLIGMMARFDPQKDHINFVHAASVLHRQHPDVHFLLCGRDITWDNEVLAEPIRAMGLSTRFHLLGGRDDIPRLAAALDIGTLSSLGEGFPTVVGETMACAVPCVVTDVGDAALIVGETGRVVPAQNAEALGGAWAELCALSRAERQAMGKAAQQRVQKLFSLPVIVGRYAALYAQMAGRDILA